MYSRLGLGHTDQDPTYVDDAVRLNLEAISIDELDPLRYSTSARRIPS